MSATGRSATDAGFEARVAPGVKITAQMSPEPREQDVQFVRQMGVEHVVLWTDASKAGPEYYTERKAYFADHGLSVFGFGNSDVHNQDAIVLGLPNRDAKVDEYIRHLRALGKAGIPYTTYAHMPNGIWSTERELTRGGAEARGFDQAKATSGRWRDRTYSLPLTNEREYEDEEVWDHFATFIRRAAPVAESEGVYIGIHPDDPPIPRLGGAPRIFSTFAGYQRALEIADSPNVGVCLCVGCWLEGGDGWGVDVLTAIRHFAANKQLFKVHFRNVDAPLPHFVETFVDDGYQDMYPVMRTLHEVGFRGVAIPDHIPRMADDPRLGTAYTIGYMKALLRRAEEEGIVTGRVNRAIELLEQDQPIYYVGGHTGHVLTRDQGREDAHIWADYINVGMEHGGFDLAGLDAYMAGLIEGGPTRSGHRTPTVIVEAPVNGTDEANVRYNAWQFRLILGRGVHGILLCQAETADAVRAFVESCRYPNQAAGVDPSLPSPVARLRGAATGGRGAAGGATVGPDGRPWLGVGTRGRGSEPTAAAVWGLSPLEYIERCDPWPLNPRGELLLGVKLESPEGVANCESILAVPGLGFAELGPGDLGLSLGYVTVPRDPYPAEMREARERVFAACRANGIAFLEGATPETIAAKIDEGVRVIAGHREETAVAGRAHSRRAMPV